MSFTTTAQPGRRLAIILRWAFLCATLCVFAAGARAQAPVGPIQPQPLQQPPLRPNIRVNVALVSTPVVVDNSKGEEVLDLNQNEFRVFDNGVQQKVVNFDLGGEPVSAAIVMETSSRVQALLPEIRKTGILFTQTVLGADGDAKVIGYNDEVDQLLKFTADHDAIEKAITNLPQGGDGAKLYDALSQAVGFLSNRPESRRRVIIAVAEAVDIGSEEKLGAVLRQAQLANITIYSVGLSSTAAAVRGEPKNNAPPSATPPGTVGLPSFPGQPQSPTLGGGDVGSGDLLALAKWTVQHTTEVVKARPLEVATTATGGLYVSTVKDSAIEDAIDRIGGELHASYLLSYRPTGTDPNGYHEIRVTVDRPGMKVRSRPGYMAAPQG
jgi:VWFA-related protein